MKIVSWNVNGLRASLRSTANQNLKEFLDRLGADIICFQETKATRVKSICYNNNNNFLAKLMFYTPVFTV